MNIFLRYYAGGMIPEEHLKIKLPENASVKFFLRLYFRTWFVHPIKRRIAKYYLVFLRNLFKLKVIGITGSAGKTTTKEILASIIKQRTNKVVYSYANIDPVFNIPTTILKCTSKTKYLVLEMGVEYPGEMDYYLWLAKPDVSVITNIFPTHTLYFGDEDGVFAEKSKIVKALDKGNWAVLNGLDKRLIKLKGKLQCKTVWINQKGEPNQVNGKMAGAVASVLGFSNKEIMNGFLKYTPADHRMKEIKHKSGAIIFDDSYNSNPKAFEASLNVFLKTYQNKNKILIIGDMLELGKLEKREHEKVGVKLSKLQVKQIIFVGKAVKFAFTKCPKALWQETYTPIILKQLKSQLNKDVALFIKGSRSIGLDRVVTSLLE